MPNAVKRGVVVRIGQKRNCVVKQVDVQKDVYTLRYMPVVGGGEVLSTMGITFLRQHELPDVLGTWEGAVEPGATGRIINAQNGQKGEVRRMATATKKKGTSKKSGSASAKKNGNKRASDEELDELAEQVVELRDEDEKSWSEIEEELGIAPGRLRALYNRGGGEPTRKRQGSAAAKKKADKKKGSAKGKGRSRRQTEEDDEDDE